MFLCFNSFFIIKIILNYRHHKMFWMFVYNIGVNVGQLAKIFHEDILVFDLESKRIFHVLKNNSKGEDGLKQSWSGKYWK